MLLKGNPPKINSYGNILPRSYLLYIFEFQLVFFAFSLVFGDPFRLSTPPPPPLSSLKVCFLWGTNFVGKIYREIVLHGGTDDHIIPSGKEFHKIHFQVI